MKICKVTLESTSPYTQTKFHDTPKKDGEGANDYEKRTWREKISCDDNGEVFISPMAFKNCIVNASQKYSEKIPGKGNSTYTKHFEGGIMVIDPTPLGVKKESVSPMWLHVPSDGKRGGTTRVMKCFPTIPHWSGEVTFHIMDDVITKPIFEFYMEKAGNFIGVGSLRPQKNGYHGRFKVVKFDWQEA